MVGLVPVSTFAPAAFATPAITDIAPPPLLLNASILMITILYDRAERNHFKAKILAVQHPVRILVMV